MPNDEMDAGSDEGEPVGTGSSRPSRPARQKVIDPNKERLKQEKARLAQIQIENAQRASRNAEARSRNLDAILAKENRKYAQIVNSAGGSTSEAVRNWADAQDPTSAIAASDDRMRKLKAFGNARLAGPGEGVPGAPWKADPLAGAMSGFDVENSPGAARKWAEQKTIDAAAAAERFKTAVTAATVSVALLGSALDAMNTKQKIGAMSAAEQNKSIGESIRSLGGTQAQADQFIKGIASGEYGNQATVGGAATFLAQMAQQKKLGPGAGLNKYLELYKLKGKGLVSDTDIGYTGELAGVAPDQAGALALAFRPQGQAYGAQEAASIAEVTRRKDEMNRQTMAGGLTVNALHGFYDRLGQSGPLGATANLLLTGRPLGFFGVDASVSTGVDTVAGGIANSLANGSSAGTAGVSMSAPMVGLMLMALEGIRGNTKQPPPSANSNAGR